MATSSTTSSHYALAALITRATWLGKPSLKRRPRIARRSRSVALLRAGELSREIGRYEERRFLVKIFGLRFQLLDHHTGDLADRHAIWSAEDSPAQVTVVA